MSNYTDKSEKDPVTHDKNTISQDDAERIIFLVGKIAEAQTGKHEVRLSVFLNKKNLDLKPKKRGLQVMASWDRLERFCELLLDQHLRILIAQGKIPDHFLKALGHEEQNEE